MITEKNVIKCEAIFNEEKTHRLWWKRVWNKDLPLACVIMLNACSADTIVTDTSTSLVVNNIAKFEEFGGVTIVNLFSLLTNKLDFNLAKEIDFNDLSNDTYIKKAAEEASIVILAWGKSADSNAKIYHRAEQVLALLENQKEKLRVISDGERLGVHPLTPQVRAVWRLASIDEWIIQSKEAAKKREAKEKAKAEASEEEDGEE